MSISEKRSILAHRAGQSTCFCCRRRLGPVARAVITVTPIGDNLPLPGESSTIILMETAPRLV